LYSEESRAEIPWKFLNVPLENYGKDSWTDGVENKEEFRSVQEERKVLQRIKGREANWIGHILRGNCLLRHVIELNREGRI